MFILTNGKEYVMENPLKQGQYVSSTSPNHAKEFTYKQARNLLQNKRKALGWIKSGKFYIVNNENGKPEIDVPKFSNEGIFVGEKDFEFDDSVVEKIKNEVDSIIGLAAWDHNQLNSYISMLDQGVQFYDNAIQDVKHVRLDKKPPAHVMTKIDKLANELEENRRDIKQCRNYLIVLLNAIKEQWTIGKIKAELSRAKYVPYKGRTKYFDIANELLGEY